MNLVNIEKTTKSKSILFCNKIIYEMKRANNCKTENLFGNFIKASKRNTNTYEEKNIFLLKKRIYKRVLIDNIKTYYLFSKKIRTINLLDEFYNKYLKKIDYDNIYFLNGNSGEIFIFIAYLLKNHMHKTNTKKPLFISTKKYHIDILKLFYPNYNYLLLKSIKIQLKQDEIEINRHKIYFIFSESHFEKAAFNINMGMNERTHYFNEILNTLNLSITDAEEKEVFIDQKIENNLTKKLKKINLNINNFIILAIEANTCRELPLVFWQNIVRELRNRNFDIFLNITNKENQLENTEFADLSFPEIYILSTKAKGIISLRSGISEFLVRSNTPSITIYTSLHNGTCAENVLSAYSLLKIPFIKKDLITEFNINNFTDLNTLGKTLITTAEQCFINKEKIQ